jgi:hypothetical protein
MQPYTGQAGSAEADFEKYMLAALADHALATGGNVQPAYMLPLIAAAVTEDSGLRPLLEALEVTLKGNYAADAAAGTFTRSRLTLIDPGVLRVFKQYRRGPTVTDAQLEQQVRVWLGTDKGVPTIQTYRAGKNGQMPFPVSATSTSTGAGSSGSSQGAASLTASSSQAGSASTSTQSQATQQQATLLGHHN